MFCDRVLGLELLPVHKPTAPEVITVDLQMLFVTAKHTNKSETLEIQWLGLSVCLSVCVSVCLCLCVCLSVCVCLRRSL